MITHTTRYIENLTETVYETISTDINTITVEQVINEDLGFHLLNKKSASFQQFYFQTLTNEVFYFATPNFFQKFKKQYALQGIDNKFLNELEKRKSEIIQNIFQDKLTELYFGSFNKVKIKHKDTVKEKDLCSFFSKLVHTFRPTDYCALDNPIKTYLGLGREGFLISFLLISNTYKMWADKNIQMVNALRSGFRQIDAANQIRHDKITDLKLLDLIFWTKADRLKKEGEASAPIAVLNSTLLMNVISKQRLNDPNNQRRSDNIWIEYAVDVIQVGKSLNTNKN